MSAPTDRICCVLLTLAIICPAASGDNRTERRQVRQVRYQVGLMFAGGRCLPDGRGEFYYYDGHRLIEQYGLLPES